MADLFEALKATKALFETRGHFSSLELRLPKKGHQWANIAGYLGHSYLFPSMDFRPASGIDTSFCFQDAAGGLEAFNAVRNELVDRLTAEFPTQTIKILRRGEATSVVIVAYTPDQLNASQKSISSTVCQQFERMLRTGNTVLAGKLPGEDLPPLADIEAQLARKIAASISDRTEARRARLTAKQNNRNPPLQIRAITTAFDRDPDVIAEALYLAQGICACCGNKAPFSRVSDNTPFLEVHHIKPLADGGLDHLDNVEALCPNCYRDMHHGPRSRRRRQHVSG